MTLQIRRATLADARALHEVAAATFPLASPPDTRPEDNQAFIAAHLSEARFQGYLADPARILFVALLDDETVGYTMLVTGEPLRCRGRAGPSTTGRRWSCRRCMLPAHHRSGWPPS
ncbi:MAG: hypothetical protein R3C32_04395 [Chloroflexota bacterium]